VLASCGGASGGRASGSVNQWLEWQREREKKMQKLGVGVGFWPILDPISFISGHEV